MLIYEAFTVLTKIPLILKFRRLKSYFKKHTKANKFNIVYIGVASLIPKLSPCFLVYLRFLYGIKSSK